jgi:hypothetical protein
MDEFVEVARELPKAGSVGWYQKTAFSDEQRAKLDDALADRNISARVISVVLQRWGYEVSPDQVAHYRRRYLAS